MKITLQVRSIIPPIQRSLLPLCAAALLASPSAFAQSTWTGLGSDNNWSTSGNWDVAPTFPAALNFAGTTQLNPNNDLTSPPFGVVVGTGSGTAITFDAAAGAFTLGGNAITMAGHFGFNGNPATVVTQAITMPLYLNQTVGFNTPINGVFAVNGGITSLGVNSIWKSGEGRMILGVGAGNTFGATVLCYGGTLQFGANDVINANPGTLWVFANSAGVPATVDLAGTTQNLVGLSIGGNTPGVDGLSNSLVDSTGSGVFKLSSGGLTCYPGGSGFSNAMATVSAKWDLNAADRNLNVGRNPANAVDLLISGPIINSAANTKGFIISQPGGTSPGVVMMTSPNNSYDGTVTLRDNKLILGANNTLPTNSLLALSSTGGGSPVVDLYGTTNMVKGLTLGAGGGATVNGSTPSIIDSVGGGVLKLGTFNLAYNAGGSGQNSTATVSATLDLNGGTRTFQIADSTFTSVEVQINGAIINSVGTAGITKGTGTGVLVLAGTNSYNGPTTVNFGTLQLNVASLNPFAAVAINNIGTANNPLLVLNFDATNTVSAFSTNGVALATNVVYNAANMPGIISGTGALRVIPAPAANTWSGGGTDDNWSTPNNWNGTLPTWTSALTFAGNTRLTPSNNLTGLTVGGITFNAAAGAFTLRGNAITNTGNIQFSGNPSTLITQAVNLDLVVSNATYQQNINSQSNGTLVLNGTISAYPGNYGASSIFKDNPGHVVFSGPALNVNAVNVRQGYIDFGTNNYYLNNLNLNPIGGMTPPTQPISQADLRGSTQTVTNLAFGSNLGSLNVPINLVDSVGGGVLKLGGNITYLSGSSINNSNGQATISATLDLNGGDRTFNISDGTNNSVDMLVNGVIINSAASTNGIVKTGLGTMVLAGTNSYHGNTSVNGGTLQLNVACLNPSAYVSVANIGTANNPLLNLNFLGTNTVSAFYTNFVAMPNGVYNAANMPGVISGSGALQVGVVTLVSTNAFAITNQVVGGNLNLSWPADHQGWRLQVQTNSLTTGLGLTWYDWPNSTNVTSVSIPIDSGNPSVFFRMVYP